MANDINDDAELIPNHNEAWSLACHKRGTSNMARAYIELRELTMKSVEGPLDDADTNRLYAICRANDDGGRVKALGHNDAEFGMKP